MESLAKDSTLRTTPEHWQQGWISFLLKFGKCLPVCLNWSQSKCLHKMLPIGPAVHECFLSPWVHHLEQTLARDTMPGDKLQSTDSNNKYGICYLPIVTKGGWLQESEAFSYCYFAEKFASCLKFPWCTLAWQEPCKAVRNTGYPIPTLKGKKKVSKKPVSLQLDYVEIMLITREAKGTKHPRLPTLSNVVRFNDQGYKNEIKNWVLSTWHLAQQTDFLLSSCLSSAEKVHWTDTVAGVSTGQEAHPLVSFCCLEGRLQCYFPFTHKYRKSVVVSSTER